MSAATVVLVHGAWHRPGPTWSAVVEGLDQRGIPAVAVALPSADPTPGRLAGLEDDAAAVTQAIEGLGGEGRPVVLCGHSYGGVVISAAGHHRDVRHLVYLAAFCLDAGETVYDVAATDPPPPIARALRFHDDGTMDLDPTLARDVLYADVDDAIARRAVGALVASTAAVFATPQPVAPAWRRTPSTYVVCEHDRAVPVDRQREMASRCATSVSLPTSHSPFLSLPADVVRILGDLAA